MTKLYKSIWFYRVGRNFVTKPWFCWEILFVIWMFAFVPLALLSKIGLWWWWGGVLFFTIYGIILRKYRQ